MRGVLQISPLHFMTFRTIILCTKGGRRHAAEIALNTYGEGLWTPRDNPLNLIRLGPAEGWLFANDNRQIFTIASRAGLAAWPR